MTVYYSGINTKNVGEKRQSVCFKHGHVQIGYFDDIAHGAEKWDNGKRCVINYCMKNKILNFCSMVTNIILNLLMLDTHVDFSIQR